METEQAGDEKHNSAPLDIADLADFDALDESEMVVTLNGRVTSWVWTFAGPGHEKSVEQSNRVARERLREQAAQEQARVNGKKWKPDDKSPDENRRSNAQFVVERLLRWSPIKLNGSDFPFSTENAMKLLLDPRKQSLLTQALEFLGEERSFTKRSAMP